MSKVRARWVVAISLAAGMLAMLITEQGVAASSANDFGFAFLQPGTASQRDADAKFMFLFDPSARWTQAIHWKYNHANAPTVLVNDKLAVIARLQSSLAKWTSQCAVTDQYDGETAFAPGVPVDGAPDNLNIVGWGPLDLEIGGWTYDWYVDTTAGRVLVDADMTLNPAYMGSINDLERIATHEWGHMIGLSHSNDSSAIMAGPPYASYNLLADPQPDDIRGCRCLYGTPAGVQAPYVCSLPRQIDFGDQVVGETSAARSITFTNSGNAPLSIQVVDTSATPFVRTQCDAGSTIAPGASCTMQVTVTAGEAGAITAMLNVFTNDGFYHLPLLANGVESTLPREQGQTVDVLEFYNATLDHYFITYGLDEIAKLDAGLTPTRWTRTSRQFKAYVSAVTGTSQVCRYYIPPQEGSSHWFGRNTAECNAAKGAHPDFVLEDPTYMQMFVPVLGVCAPGTIPVYRVFDNRADANHRYMTDRLTRNAMVARGWIAEGDGPDLVVMCAPQ